MSTQTANPQDSLQRLVSGTELEPRSCSERAPVRSGVGGRCVPPMAAQLVANIEHGTFIDALRACAESAGHGAFETISFCFYRDEAEKIKAWVKVHGKAKLQKEILCLIAEAK